MPTNETKYVTEQILTYYDSKLKTYIDEKAIQPHNELERRVDEVETNTAVNGANIQSHREELDDLEAAVTVLQQDNKDIAQNIADLRIAVENMGGGTTSDVTKEYIDSRIEEAIESLQIPEADNFVTKDEFDSSLEDLPTSDDLRQLNESVANVEASLEEKANKDEIPSLEGLATEQFVIDKVSEINVPDTDLSNYYTKDEVDTLIPDVSKFATTEDLSVVQEKSVQNETKIQELSTALSYVKEELKTIPSIEGLATEQYVDNAVNNIKIPDVSQFVTQSKVNELLNTKSDAILFKTDMRVSNALGGFAEDASVQNMTIAEILTTLLGLKVYNPPQGILEGTPEAAIKIITEEIPSYMLSNTGDMVVNSYTYRKMTTSEGKQDNQDDSFFYQIVDDNEAAVETGYQIASRWLDEGYLTVLLPEDVTEFDVKVYDATSGGWTTAEWTLLETAEYSRDGYIAYIADPAYEIYQDIAIRVVIK